MWNANIGADTRYSKNCKLLSIVASIFTFSPIYQIKACGLQACGEPKKKTKSFVETMYGFESGHSKKAIAAN